MDYYRKSSTDCFNKMVTNKTTVPRKKRSAPGLALSGARNSTNTQTTAQFGMRTQSNTNKHTQQNSFANLKWPAPPETSKSVKRTPITRPKNYSRNAANTT